MAKSPSQVVSDFYEWYLGFAPGAGNPLVSHAYRTRSELSPAFIATLDKATSSGTLMYDPVLCAQNVPSKVTPGTEAIAGETATVPMTSSFQGQHWTVLLTRTAGTWLISEIRCSS